MKALLIVSWGTRTVLYPAGGMVITYCVWHTAILQISASADVHDDDSVGECFEGKRTEVGGEQRHQ